MAAALRIVPLLGRGICHALAQMFGTLGYFLDRKGRAVALDNVECALGCGARRCRAIVRRSYRIFAATLIDSFWSSRLTPQNFRHYIDVEGFERVEEESSQLHSTIAVSIHYGNIEWLSLAMGFLGYPGDIVAERPKNPSLEPLMQRARKRSGNRIIPRQGAIARLYRTLRRGGRAAILIDLNVRPTQPAVVIDCFGLETCVTLAHAWLHQRAGATLIPAYCEPRRGGRWSIVCLPKINVPPRATATQIAQLCWDTFEPVIRHKPAPWLWMYKHWRFRPETSERKYPFYANASRQFEKLKKRLREEEAEPASSH